MEQSNNEFEFTYSAPQQEEVRKIREKYLPKEQSKMDQLRQLDQQVTQKGTALSVALGTVGALLLGIGMCCAMVWKGLWFIPGIIVGILGIGVVSLAYPLYIETTRKERERVAPEILRLTEELMGGQA